MELLLQRLSDRVWYLPADHETDRPVLGAVIGDEHTLLIDAGNSPAHAKLFLKELEKVNAPQSRILVITHWHWDHIFGMNEINLPAISHSLTKKYIEIQKQYEWTQEALDERVKNGLEIEFCAEMIKKELGSTLSELQIVSPAITFEKELVIDLGSVTCRVVHVGGDHADDSSVVFVEEEQILFLGDCHSPDIYKPQRQYTPEVLLKLLADLNRFPAEIALHSHSKPEARDAFHAELDELKIITEILLQNLHEEEKFKVSIEQQLNRSLNKEDLEFINQLKNGMKPSN